jgi:hypothetical protein
VPKLLDKKSPIQGASRRQGPALPRPEERGSSLALERAVDAVFRRRADFGTILGCVPGNWPPERAHALACPDGATTLSLSVTEQLRRCRLRRMLAHWGVATKVQSWCYALHGVRRTDGSDGDRA